MNDEYALENIRQANDLAGVFEFDGETGYFYLYEMSGPSGKIIDHIRVCSFKDEIDKKSISIKWDEQEEKVGLFIKGVLWALFDTNDHSKSGGDYKNNLTPSIPSVKKFI